MEQKDGTKHKTNHVSEDCFYKDNPRCKYCGKRNHKSADCYRKEDKRVTTKSRNKVRTLEVNIDDMENPDYEEEMTDEDSVENI